MARAAWARVAGLLCCEQLISPGTRTLDSVREAEIWVIMTGPLYQPLYCTTLKLANDKSLIRFDAKLFLQKLDL